MENKNVPNDFLFGDGDLGVVFFLGYLEDGDLSRRGPQRCPSPTSPRMGVFLFSGFFGDGGLGVWGDLEVIGGYLFGNFLGVSFFGLS